MPVLMFCEKCGRPKKLSEYVLSQYVARSPRIYCDDCNHSNTITSELREFALKLKN